MAFLEKTVALGTSDTELYICPATLSGSAHGLTFSNITGSDEVITLKLYSHLTGLTTQITSAGQVIPANSQFTWPKPINMVSGDKIIALAGSAPAVVAVIAVYLSVSASPSSAFVPRGAWSSSANYAVNDVVVLSGTSYVAVATNTNSTPPSADWMVLAEKGDPGADGADGAPGADGVDGVDGVDGLSGVTEISFGTTGLTPSTNTSGAVTVAGTLGVANGGTGATTLTINNVLLGNGASTVQEVAPGTSGNVLISNGTTWTSQAPAPSGVSTGKSIAMAIVFGF